MVFMPLQCKVNHSLPDLTSSLMLIWFPGFVYLEIIPVELTSNSPITVDVAIAYTDDVSFELLFKVLNNFYCLTRKDCIALWISFM